MWMFKSNTRCSNKFPRISISNNSKILKELWNFRSFDRKVKKLSVNIFRFLLSKFFIVECFAESNRNISKTEVFVTLPIFTEMGTNGE